MHPKTLTLVAPLSGIVVKLDDVPDAVFAQRMVGDGVSVDPVSQTLLAPCDARVIQVHRAGHALTLSAAGLEIVIHVGLDTVELKGHGFTPVVKAGDEVRTGDTLLTFDADYVATHARSLLTQIVITNMDRVAAINTRAGKVRAGRDVLMEVTLASGFQDANPELESETIESGAAVIGCESGLHARPAAMVAAAARQFRSDVRLIKDGRDANARSVVSIMALEVAGGDTLRVLARGDDAAAALAAVTQALERHSAHDAPMAGAAPAPARLAVAGTFSGVAASPGVAIGQVFQLRHDDVVIAERASDPNQERRALDAAVASAHLQLETLQARLVAEADSERAEIFGAHQELLEDPEVLDAASQAIHDGASAAFAWRAAYSAQAERLTALNNPLLAGRATDLRDIGRRVLHLLVGREGEPPQVPQDSIIVAEDFTPSEAASIDRTRVRGFCTTMGSATSHAAILARALGIPAVAAIDPRALEIATGTRVVLDGDAGTLRVDPDKAEEAAILRRQETAARRQEADLAVAADPATTSDGHRIEVLGNIGDVEEASRVVALGGEGVGLLRTEFLFMERRAAPDEDEQARVYEAIARTLGREQLFIIRTLDVGGDKPLSYMPMGFESNPFLGERGIRMMLNRPDVMRTQIRAILRASKAGRVAVMFPMIATLAEWRAARAMVEEERATLGVTKIPVGIMIETASAALIADRFAEEADFFSIGTNDLTQYTLAMDRTNPRLAAQVDALHPAVLKLISLTVTGAGKHGRPVGVCGAVAGDPAAIPVLIGLGVNELSVSVPIIPAVKARIRSLSLDECRETARVALEAGDGAEVRALVAHRHGGAR